jgi:hypothetical protein
MRPRHLPLPRQRPRPKAKCQAEKLDTTTVLGWVSFGAGYSVFGSAAPGIASVRITLSDGKTVTARPVGVGNEDLFAFVLGTGATPAGWTAYDAAGRQIGIGSAASVSATASKSAKP